MRPEEVAKYSRIHTRCGTSFIMMAMILMILIFTFVGQTTALARVGIKILLLPVIAGISYELFRLPILFPNSKIAKALVSPGLALQRLTTREPELDQLEVAIAALTSVPGFEPNGGYTPAPHTEAENPVKPISAEEPEEMEIEPEYDLTDTEENPQ